MGVGGRRIRKTVYSTLKECILAKGAAWGKPYKVTDNRGITYYVWAQSPSDAKRYYQYLVTLQVHEVTLAEASEVLK